MSSSDLPVVSGTNFQVMYIYGRHIRPNSQKTPAGDNVVISQGVNCPIRKVPIHNEKPAADMANPRTRAGYISESSTQITTQIEMAQLKI